MYTIHSLIPQKEMRFMEQVFKYVDRMSTRYIDELARLCSMRSVKGDENGLGNARRMIKEKLDGMGFSPEEYGKADEASIVFGRRTIDKKKLVLFYNHYDIVPEGNENAWIAPPFTLTERGERLYARGVSDNKGALMARLQAIEAILAVKGSLPAGVAFLFDGDEETGSITLSRMVEEEAETVRKITDADLCLWENGRTLPDGSPEAAFGVRSTLTVTLKVKSSNGEEHGRMGAELPNAAWRLVWALATLKDINENILIDGFYDDVAHPTQADIDVLQNYPYDENGMLKRKEISEFLLGLSGLELKKKIFLQPSLNINGIESGEPWKGFRHIIPNEASARFRLLLQAVLLPRLSSYCPLHRLCRSRNPSAHSPRAYSQRSHAKSQSLPLLRLYILSDFYTALFCLQYRSNAGYKPSLCRVRHISASSNRCHALRDNR